MERTFRVYTMARKIRAVLLVLALVFGLPVASFAQRGGGGHHSGGSHRGTSKKSSSASHNKHGRIKRSEAAKDQFMRDSGYPHGRKGYMVDHRVPLACGGADSPSNMQWQTKADAKAKDQVERKGC
jgi:hypothetical protein